MLPFCFLGNKMEMETEKAYYNEFFHWKKETNWKHIWKRSFKFPGKLFMFLFSISLLSHKISQYLHHKIVHNIVHLFCTIVQGIVQINSSSYRYLTGNYRYFTGKLPVITGKLSYIIC